MLKVLIVDNEEIICKGLSVLIPWDEYGFQYPEFSFDGTDGLSKLEQTAYDLLITDLRMPGLDGIDLCREARKIRPECEIIIISGYSDFHSAQLAFDYRVLGYLLKPIDDQKLASLVQQVATKKASSPKDELYFYENFVPNGELLQDYPATLPADLSHAIANEDVESAQKCINLFIGSLYQHKPKKIARLALCFQFLKSLMDMLSGINVNLLAYMAPAKTIQEYCDVESLSTLSDTLTTLIINVNQHLESRRMSRSQKTVDDICEYIQLHYSEKLTVSSLASHFHLTPAYLGRLFKKETDLSLHQYIHTCRIEQAKQLIATSDMGLSCISAAVGYSDLSNFYSQFKKATALTPDQYRELSRRHNNENSENEFFDVEGVKY